LNQKGFTLIEMIAVLIILSILTAVAVPKIINLQDNAEKKLMLSVLADFDAQEQLAWIDNNLSDDPKTPYDPPIHPTEKMGNGMTLKGEDSYYILFTGGGNYDVYRWTYEDDNGKSIRPAHWSQNPQDDGDSGDISDPEEDTCPDGYSPGQNGKCKKDKKDKKKK
jgi:prepilin-type N-terminal cleavage/methylation domain-containing protein